MSTSRDPFTNRTSPTRMQGRRPVGRDSFEHFDREFNQHFRTVRRAAIGGMIFNGLVTLIGLGLLTWLGIALFQHFT